MGTKFSEVYNRFLDKITDDMYMELTPQDTVKDLQHMLIAALPCFEFPRIDLMNYSTETIIKMEKDVTDSDFVLGQVWNEIEIDDLIDGEGYVIVENSSFNANLSSEEINILAILMMCGWVQRQLTSIENTRMKYSGSDFKFTSQANHMSKLQNLLTECVRQSHHQQRLYKRRRLGSDSVYRSNWDSFDFGVYYGKKKRNQYKTWNDSTGTIADSPESSDDSNDSSSNKPIWNEMNNNE